MNKLKFITSFFIFILMVYACGGSYYENKRDKKTTDTNKITIIATLTGSGDKIKMESLKEGLAIFESFSTMLNNNSSGFTVWLKDSDGNKIDLIAKTKDGENSTSACNVPKDGTYIIEVTSKGSWNIIIKQKR